MPRYTIDSEDQAFRLLEDLLDGVQLGADFQVRFEGWPRFVITVQGADFDGTIPTRVMPTLLELQRQVHRLYCKTTYGSDNLRRLSKQDRESLELLVRVEKGSSFFETLLNEPLFSTLQAAVGKMAPEQVMIVLIVFGILATSLIGWKLWLSERGKEKELDQEVRLSQLETERIALITRATQQLPLAGELAQGIDPVRNQLLGNLKHDDRLEVLASGRTGEPLPPPVVVTGAEAEQLTKAIREASIEKLISAEFMLLAADFSKPGVVRVELQRMADGYSFRADVPAGLLDTEQERALRDKSWERQALPLTVLVHELHQRYSNAKVVGVGEGRSPSVSG